MEDEKDIISESDNAIAETLIDFQTKYENEKKARELAESKIVELTKVIRTMQIKPSIDEDEKEKTLDEQIIDLFE